MKRTARSTKYLSTLHKVSDILSRAIGVEALFDSIAAAVLDVTGGDRAAILIRNKASGTVDMVTVRTTDGLASGEVKLSRSVVNDVLERGISAFTDDALAASGMAAANRSCGTHPIGHVSRRCARR